MSRSREQSPPPESWYRETAPPPALAEWVVEFWEMRIPGVQKPTRVRILPNACVDLVVYVSEASQGEGVASAVGPPHRCFVVGSTLRSFMVQSVGWRHVIGASLSPAGVEPLLGLPAAVVGDRIVTLADLLGSTAVRFEDQVLSGHPEGALSRMVGQLLEWGRTREPRDSLAHRVIQNVRQASGRRRIDAVADDLKVSGRRLERHFLSQVGLTPKLFSRLVRFDRAVRDLGARGATSWAEFALTHGYSDQAHFINEFREFAGLTPAEFEAENRGGGMAS